MTEKEAIEQYNEYLKGHISNISEALELFKELEIPFVVDNYEELKEICSKHDASKYEDVEYIPYRKHFYPINDDEKLESEAFELACRHHIKNNKHHWDYWLNDNNELEIPDEHEYKLYCVERCCDWLSMANQHGEGPMDWYNANKDAMIMPDYGFELCEEILSKVPSDFKLSFDGVRGKLDESTLSDLNSKYANILMYNIEQFKNRQYADDKKSKYITTYHAKLKDGKVDIYAKTIDELDDKLSKHKKELKEYAYAKDVTTKELDRNHVQFITYLDNNQTVRDFDNVTRLFEFIKQCGGFSSFKGIMWFIKSDYKDGEFYLVRDRYHKGGWKWEDVNGNTVDAYDSKTFAIKPDKKAAVKQMYNAGDGTFMIELNDGWVTDYGTNYIQAIDKNDAIIELNYRVSYVGSDEEINESSNYWKTLKPEIEDTENDRKGVEMYKEKIKNGYHRPILINKNDEILDGNHTMTAYQELGIEPKMLYRGERKDFYDAVPKSEYDAEKAIHYMIKNGTATPIDEAAGPSKEYLKKNFKKIKFNSNFSSAEIINEYSEETSEDIEYRELVNIIRQAYPNFKFTNQGLPALRKIADGAMKKLYKIAHEEKEKEDKHPKYYTRQDGTKMIRNDAGGYEELDESFKVERGGKGYLVEASMSQLKRTTLTQDPTRAKKSKHVQSKYIGISKYGVLNFMTSSETHSGVKWYQEVQFPSFQGFMNIVEQGDDIDATDVQKAMKSDNIKISCDDPSFLYWAWKYKAWKDVYGLEKETRAPKRNNTRLKGALCKHLYSVIELLNEKRIIDLIARDLNEWCKRQLGIENNGYQDADGMLQKDFKANQYDYNIEDVYKTLLSRENFKKYQDGTPLEDLGLSDKEMKDIENAIKGMRDRSQFALKSELEKEFEPVKRGRKIKRDDIKLTVGNADDNEEEAK